MPDSNITSELNKVLRGVVAPSSTNTIAPVVVGDHNPANDAGFNLANYQQFRRRALIRTVDARNLGL